jgi:hypothetical protein
LSLERIGHGRPKARLWPEILQNELGILAVAARMAANGLERPGGTRYADSQIKTTIPYDDPERDELPRQDSAYEEQSNYQ